MAPEGKYISIKDAAELLGLSRVRVSQLGGLEPQIQRARDPETGEALRGLFLRDSVLEYKEKRDAEKRLSDAGAGDRDE